MKIKTDEITSVLKQEIEQFGAEQNTTYRLMKGMYVMRRSEGVEGISDGLLLAYLRTNNFVLGLSSISHL